MNKFAIDAEIREEPEYRAYKGSSSSVRVRPPADSYDDRIAELEVENSRLHRLVAELLIKNEQLRKPD
jgi:hypothetical protein